MPFATIFTPTFNRRHLLGRLYDSLERQDDRDFVWMIIDDGSDDGTREYISELRQNSSFSIEYYYKNNGGLNSAYNEAFNHIKTEVSFGCDSDDWLPPYCISTIKRIWGEKVRCVSKCAGIVGLDGYADGRIVGKRLRSIEYINYNEETIHGRIRGDKKLILKSYIYKALNQIEAPNREKDFNPHYYHVQISERYNWFVVNEILCFVEYQEDGMTRSIWKQYKRSPNSFLLTRRLYYGLRDATLRYKVRQMIHYDAECMLAGRWRDIVSEASPNKVLGMALLPLGVLLYICIRVRNANG